MTVWLIPVIVGSYIMFKITWVWGIYMINWDRLVLNMNIRVIDNNLVISFIAYIILMVILVSVIHNFCCILWTVFRARVVM